MELSAKAKSICEQNYGGWQAKVNGCDRCPLHRQCSTQTQAGQQAYDAWVSSINAAADRAA